MSDFIDPGTILPALRSHGMSERAIEAVHITLILDFADTWEPWPVDETEICLN